MLHEIQILISGLSKLDTGKAYERHSHPYYQLNHIVRGSYIFTVDSQKFTADVGDTIMIPMNSVHSLTDVSDETGYYFEVKFSAFSQGVKEMCSEIGPLVKGDDFSGRLFKEIFDEHNNAAPTSEEIMVTYLYAILFKLTARKRRELRSPSKYIEVAPYSAPVQATIRFLEDNYQRHLSLDDILAQTSFKKSFFCGLFKRETTVTIFECLMIVRIRKAVELLTYTNLSLAQISESTGFVSITHFNRVFTKHVMIPPGQYRKHLNSQSFYWSEATSNPIIAATLGGRRIEFPQMAQGS